MNNISEMDNCLLLAFLSFRYTVAVALPSEVCSCKHHVRSKSSKAFACGKVSGRDLEEVRRLVFRRANKVYQDSVIASYMAVEKVKRRRPGCKEKGKSKTRNFSVRYKVGDILNAFRLICALC